MSPSPNSPKALPRGIRNHNPGNLRRSTDRWQGLAAVQADASFFTFDAPLWGIRALAIVLLNYQDKHGLDTLTEIISRFAPPVENNTTAYVKSVAAACGLTPDQPFEVRDQLGALILAVIQHENGCQPYDQALIDQAVGLALKARPE